MEKPNSLFARGGYTDKEAERNILANPFKRFEDMQMLRHTRTLGIVQVDESVWKKLTVGEKAEMEKINTSPDWPDKPDKKMAVVLILRITAIYFLVIRGRVCGCS